MTDCAKSDFIFKHQKDVDYLFFLTLRAGITYPIFTDTYITDLYFSIYCIYFFEPETFFCK